LHELLISHYYCLSVFEYANFDWPNHTAAWQSAADPVKQRTLPIVKARSTEIFIFQNIGTGHTDHA
jgi:hypothetical protein